MAILIVAPHRAHMTLDFTDTQLPDDEAMEYITLHERRREEEKILERRRRDGVRQFHFVGGMI